MEAYDLVLYARVRSRSITRDMIELNMDPTGTWSLSTIGIKEVLCNVYTVGGHRR